MFRIFLNWYFVHHSSASQAMTHALTCKSRSGDAKITTEHRTTTLIRAIGIFPVDTCPCQIHLKSTCSKPRHHNLCGSVCLCCSDSSPYIILVVNTTPINLIRYQIYRLICRVINCMLFLCGFGSDIVIDVVYACGLIFDVLWCHDAL